MQMFSITLLHSTQTKARDSDIWASRYPPYRQYMKRTGVYSSRNTPSFPAVLRPSEVHTLGSERSRLDMASKSGPAELIQFGHDM